MPTMNPSYVAGEDILPRLIVRQDTSYDHQILKCTLAYKPIGVLHEGTVYAPIPTVSTNYGVLSGYSARVYGPGEVCEIDVGTVAITAGDNISADSNGKAQPSVHGFWVIGRALAAASASTKVRVQIVDPYIENKSGTVLAKTADYTVALADLGKVLTNTSASGAVTFALPAAVVGYEVFARVDAVQELRLDPNGSEQICLPSTGVPGAAGKYLVADALNETVHLRCRETGIWDAMTYAGTWTAEG